MVSNNTLYNIVFREKIGVCLKLLKTDIYKFYIQNNESIFIIVGCIEFPNLLIYLNRYSESAFIIDKEQDEFIFSTSHKLLSKKLYKKLITAIR